MIRIIDQLVMDPIKLGYLIQVLDAFGLTLHDFGIKQEARVPQVKPRGFLKER